MLSRQAAQKCLGKGMSRHRSLPRATLSTDTPLQSLRKDMFRQHFAKFHHSHPERQTPSSRTRSFRTTNAVIASVPPRHPMPGPPCGLWPFLKFVESLFLKSVLSSSPDPKLVGIGSKTAVILLEVVFSILKPCRCRIAEMLREASSLLLKVVCTSALSFPVAKDAERRAAAKMVMTDVLILYLTNLYENTMLAERKGTKSTNAVNSSTKRFFVHHVDSEYLCRIFQEYG